MKLCMCVGYHTANNVSNFGGDPVTQLNLKKAVKKMYAVLRATAHNSRDAATGFAVVATRSRADCSSMEGHTSLSTALVSRSCRCAIS